MPPLNLLIVEDEDSLLKFYRDLLKDERLAGKFEGTMTKSAEEALRALRQRAPALVILDWILPGKDGMAVLEAVRSNPKTRHAMLIVVTTVADKHKEVEALEAGADDYLVKPFDREVLVARLLNLAKRLKLPAESEEIVRLKELRLEMPRGRLWLGTSAVELHPKEAALLRIFMKRPRMVHSALFLWEQAWGYESDDFSNALQTTMSHLRTKLGPVWGKRLENIKGRGYVLDA